MKAIQLREGFYWTGVLDENLRVFDIIMETEFGTTYNSYVLRAGDKTVLFETAKAGFFDEYLEKLREVIDVTAIDYLVMSHTEPDHAGSLERLLEHSPQMEVLATGCALGFLKEITNREFRGSAVKDGQELVIGDKTLCFLQVPNLHWPDTMYTYIKEEKILVTCDSFGAHYCLPEVVSEGIQKEDEYEKALKYYFDNIIGPFKPFMRKALQKIASLELSMICTGHGPVLVGEKIGQVLQRYREWTAETARPVKRVVIAYVSAYGYTGMLAEQIAAGVRAAGEAAGKGPEVELFDMVTADREEVSGRIAAADGFLLGTPTILGDALKPIWELTLSMTPVTHGGKQAAAFGSYGWSGEGVPNITERLKQLKLKVSDGFRVRFKPSETELSEAFAYGRKFGELVLGIK